jgi:HEAT repeat protein
MPEPLKEIIDLLHSPDEQTRSRGMERIAIEGNSHHIAMLLIAMKDESFRLRNKAKTLILQKEPDAILPHLEDALRDQDDAGRRNAAMEIYVSLSEAAVPPLSKLAADPDKEVGNFACVLLGMIESPASVPALIEALKDEDVNVSHAAAESLGKIKDPRALEPLIEALDGGDFWRAFPIITALGELKDELAVKPVLRYLDNEFFILTACQALGKIASPTALSRLLPLLLSEEPHIRSHALQALVSIQKSILAEKGPGGDSGPFLDPRLIEAMGGQPFRSYLVSLLSSQETELAHDALVALGWLREDRAVPRMIELIKDESLQTAALESLIAIGQPALYEVEKHLDHPVGMVRHALLQYLGSLGLEQGGPHIRGMLVDEMSIVRAQAALTLGKLGDLAAVDGLIIALGDLNPEVQEAAITALSSLDPKVVFEKLVPYLRNGNPQYMYLAAETLGLLRLEDAVKPLTTLLEDPRDVIREVAVKSIGRIGGEKATHPLLMSLKDESPRVRQQAIISLGKMRDPLVLNKLLSLLKDKDNAVRYYAIRALRDQGSSLAVQPLVELLEGAPKNLVIATVETLGSLGDKSACQALLRYATVGDRDLLRTSAQALGEVGCQESVSALLALLSSGHWSVRSAAACSLGKIGGKGVFEALSGLLAEADLVVLKTAVTALGELGDSRAARLLVPLLHNDFLGKAAYDAILMLGPCAVAEVPRSLAGAPVPTLLKGARLLGDMGDPAGLPFLMGLLTHLEPALRREAASALGKLGLPDALGELRRLEGSDEEEMVRQAAAKAVRKIPQDA